MTLRQKKWYIAVYNNHHFTDSVAFRKKWMAYAFQWLLNHSVMHNGAWD